MGSVATYLPLTEGKFDYYVTIGKWEKHPVKTQSYGMATLTQVQQQKPRLILAWYDLYKETVNPLLKPVKTDRRNRTAIF